MTVEEINDPHLVFQGFFASETLAEVKEKMWEYFKVTITGAYPHQLDGEEQDQVIIMYENLERLVEAAYLTREQQLAN